VIRWLLFDQPTWVSNLSNLTSVTVLLSILAYLRARNCSMRRCPFPGRHPVKDTTYRTCHRHTTRAHHDALTVRHATERPDQHHLLNPKG
jgi:hypothetical protein